MKTLAVAMVITVGLAAWIPSAPAQEYSAATNGENLREPAEAYPAHHSGKNVNVRHPQEAAVTSRDRSNAQPDHDDRKTVTTGRERSTNAHNVKTMTANYQALYDRMPDAQKKTAVFRNRMNAAEPSHE